MFMSVCLRVCILLSLEARRGWWELSCGCFEPNLLGLQNQQVLYLRSHFCSSKISLIYSCIHVCLWMSVMYAQVLQRPEEGVGTLGTGVIGIGEPLMWVLWTELGSFKRNSCSYHCAVSLAPHIVIFRWKNIIIVCMFGVCVDICLLLCVGGQRMISFCGVGSFTFMWDPGIEHIVWF